MKKLIAVFTALLFTAGSATFASTEGTKKYNTEQSSYSESFTKIVIEDDIDVVLYENGTTNIQFDGNARNISRIEWVVKKGVLYLRSKNGSLKDKVLVTIDVNALENIVIEGDSKVRSLGILSSEELNVHLSTSSYVAIRSLGKINISNSEGTELVVKKHVGKISIPAKYI